MATSLGRNAECPAKTIGRSVDYTNSGVRMDPNWSEFSFLQNLTNTVPDALQLNTNNSVLLGIMLWDGAPSGVLRQ